MRVSAGLPPSAARLAISSRVNTCKSAPNGEGCIAGDKSSSFRFGPGAVGTIKFPLIHTNLQFAKTDGHVGSAHCRLAESKSLNGSDHVVERQIDYRFRELNFVPLFEPDFAVRVVQQVFAGAQP